MLSETSLTPDETSLTPAEARRLFSGETDKVSRTLYLFSRSETHEMADAPLHGTSICLQKGWAKSVREYQVGNRPACVLVITESGKLELQRRVDAARARPPFR